MLPKGRNARGKIRVEGRFEAAACNTSRTVTTTAVGFSVVSNDSLRALPPLRAEGDHAFHGESATQAPRTARVPAAQRPRFVSQCFDRC